MTRGVMIGFLLTGMTLLVFLLWTFLETRRVDRVIEEVGTRDADEEAETSPGEEAQ